MTDQDEEDLKLVRASAELIKDIHELSTILLWKRAQLPNTRVAHRFVRERDLNRLIQKIEPFQEDPQLLDAHLNGIVTQLWQCYIASLNLRPATAKTSHIPITLAIGRILYVLCKVRGEKIIVGLLSNETRYLEPLVLSLERATGTSVASDDITGNISTWEERYLLFLWLTHLLLAPFSLASISTDPGATVSVGDISLSDGLPGIPKRLIPIAVEYMKAPTREQNAAASLLVRLTLRPDMKSMGLTDQVVSHFLSKLRTIPNEPSLHDYMGLISFLNRLTGSGTHDEIGKYMQSIFVACQTIMEADNYAFLKSSATARKQIIKIFRNIAVMALTSPVDGLDPGSTLEEVIGFLLESLGDGDTPVRMAASKSLSLLTMQLDDDTSADVLDALLESLNVDILWTGSQRNLAAVNPLRWHGLTLTLSHLLFRRALPKERLPDLLNALLLALNFEQKSATGNSIGTNVRDAANFGLWSVARRYRTIELANVDIRQIRAANQQNLQLPVLHMLALSLLQSAAVDPAGNVRRGSSAALQELIGRHPDAIPAGISLVQIVDYQGVGLRASAMKRGVVAAELDTLYWNSIYESLRGWRGLYSSDISSRLSAASNIAQLSKVSKKHSAADIISDLLLELNKIPLNRVEERHGFMIAIARLIESEATVTITDEHKTTKAKFAQVVTQLFTKPQQIIPKATEYFRSPLRRPNLTICATLELIIALYPLLSTNNIDQVSGLDLAYFEERFEVCIRRRDQIVLDLVPAGVSAFLLQTPDVSRIVQGWLHCLQHEIGNGSRFPGIVLALGAALPLLNKEEVDISSILNALVRRCSNPVEVEGRVIALQALHHFLRALPLDAEANREVIDIVSGAILTGLNDNTVNDRGDIGSLVRIEAMLMVEELWRRKLLVSTPLMSSIHATVVRLALEKLDRVRITAAKSLKVVPRDVQDSPLNIDQIDTEEYFRSALELLASTSDDHLRLAIVQGYCSSAGLGSENILHISRQALCSWALSSTKSSMSNSYLLLTTLMNVIKGNLINERVLIPCLETLAFLGDFGIFTIIEQSAHDIKWMTLLSLVQKSHYQTTSIPKLLAALEVYRSLAFVQQIRKSVLTKLKSMLLHPFPKIRISAAETLYMCSESAQLKTQDWSQAVSKLKLVTSGIEVGS